MPSTVQDAVSSAPRAVTRYYRFERPLAATVALGVGAVVAVAFLSLSLVEALLVTVAVIGVVRAPLFWTSGHSTLETDRGVDAVLADMTGPTPPVLAFQWGCADEVIPTDEGARWEFSYLFGLRSVTMSLSVERIGDDAVELSLSSGGRPWGRYEMCVHDEDGSTVVDVDVTSGRRFGLRRVPQWLLTRRYRERAMAELGYSVREQEAALRFGRRPD